MASFLDPIGRALANVATLGYYSHPAIAHQYWAGQAQSVNPTTTAGIANLASLMMPGDRGGFAGLTQRFGAPTSQGGPLVSPRVPVYQPPPALWQALVNHLQAAPPHPASMF